VSAYIPPGSENKSSPGYRQSRRTSKAGKKAKRAEQISSATEAVTTPLAAFGRFVGRALFALLIGAIVLLIAAVGINHFARWSALRAAGGDVNKYRRDQQAKENLLIIGVENKHATGFLAVRIDAVGKQVFGIAIPDGAFIEVPGQGFERVGDSYNSGPDISAAAVTNYLGAPFRSWVVVPSDVYGAAIKNQSLAGIPGAVLSSNLDDTDKRALKPRLDRIPQKNVALVPLPVKPIRLGDQTYFEPQRAEVADLLKSWWGVDINDAQKITRVIVYNGAGTPGIAGEAAQVLIRAGFRVVDTKNADRFDYKTTQIIVQQGSTKRGQDAAAELGVGTVVSNPATQDVADLIIIIGKDFVPPAGGAKGGTKQ
jgi:hypothetical protein